MSENWKNSEDGGEDVQMPLGVGEGDAAPSEEDYNDSRPKINNSTLALFAAFAAALAVLYLLGLQNKPRAATAEQVDHERAVSEKIQNLITNNVARGKIESVLDDTSHLVKILMTYLDARQPDNGKIPNPFLLPVKEEGPVGPIGPVGPDQSSIAAEEYRRNTAAEFQSLKLQMVMMGTHPSAMINNRIVNPGDQFKYLSVKEVTSNSVILTNSVGSFELKLSNADK